MTPDLNSDCGERSRGGYLPPYLRVVGMDGVAELRTVMEVVVGTVLSLSDSEGS